MSHRSDRRLADLLEAASWMFATKDRVSGRYFLDSAVRCLTISGGAKVVYDAGRRA